MSDPIVSLLTEIRDLLIEIRGQAKPAKKKSSGTVEHWQEMVNHIDRMWQRKKGSKYPFTPSDMVALKTFAKLYMPWGVMALWDVFLASDDPFYKQTGHRIKTFSGAIPRLLDFSWKPRAEEYRQKLEPQDMGIANLVAGLSNGAKL